MSDEGNEWKRVDLYVKLPNSRLHFFSSPDKSLITTEGCLSLPAATPSSLHSKTTAHSAHSALCVPPAGACTAECSAGTCPPALQQGQQNAQLGRARRPCSVHSKVLSWSGRPVLPCSVSVWQFAFSSATSPPPVLHRSALPAVAFDPTGRGYCRPAARLHFIDSNLQSMICNFAWGNHSI